MPNPPRRPRFQIHLSTMIVLTFTAGFLLWANMQERASGGTPVPKHKHDHFFFSGTPAMWEEYNKPNYLISRGWPLPITGVWYGRAGNEVWHQPSISYWMPIINVLIILVILSVIWQFCEFLIRRRAARKKG